MNGCSPPTMKMILVGTRASSYGRQADVPTDAASFYDGVALLSKTKLP